MNRKTVAEANEFYHKNHDAPKNAILYNLSRI
jgi:hypothetical protein